MNSWCTRSTLCNVFIMQDPQGNRIQVLSQAVIEIVISLLNHPTDSSLKAVVQVLKVRTVQSLENVCSVVRLFLLFIFCGCKHFHLIRLMPHQKY